MDKLLDEAAARGEIVCPVSGEIVDGDDIDGLLAMFQRIQRVRDTMESQLRDLKAHLWNMTTSENKTRYLMGQRLEAKLQEPRASWDQSLLKELWNSFPDLALRYMRISTLSPNLREVDAMRRADGNPQFEGFKKIFLSAERPPTSWPIVTVKEAKK